MGFGIFHLDYVQKMNTTGAPCQSHAVMWAPFPSSETFVPKTCIQTSYVGNDFLIIGGEHIVKV